jgi:hypothetical protein
MRTLKLKINKIPSIQDIKEKQKRRLYNALKQHLAIREKRKRIEQYRKANEERQKRQQLSREEKRILFRSRNKPHVLSDYDYDLSELFKT